MKTREQRAARLTRIINAQWAIIAGEAALLLWLLARK